MEDKCRLLLRPDVVLEQLWRGEEFVVGLAMLWALPRLTLRTALGLSEAALRVTLSFEGVG